MERGGLADSIERRAGVLCLEPATIAAAGAEVGQEGGKAMDWQAVGRQASRLFLLRRRRLLSGRDGVAGGAVLLQVLVARDVGNGSIPLINSPDRPFGAEFIGFANFVIC